jgi:hypothetical protein
MLFATSTVMASGILVPKCSVISDADNSTQISNSWLPQKNVVYEVRLVDGKVKVISITYDEGYEPNLDQFIGK